MEIQDGQGFKDKVAQVIKDEAKKAAQKAVDEAIKKIGKDVNKLKDYIKNQPIPNNVKKIAYIVIDEALKQGTLVAIDAVKGGDPYYYKYLKYKKLYTELKMQNKNTGL